MKTLFKPLHPFRAFSTTTDKYRPPRPPLVTQGTIPVYLCTRTEALNIGRYKQHLPLPFVALGTYLCLSNLLTSPASFLKAFLWLFPTGFSWQLRTTLRDNAGNIVKEVKLTHPDGTHVLVTNVLGETKQYAIRSLRAPSAQEMRVLSDTSVAAKRMLETYRPVIVEPRHGLIQDVLYIDVKANGVSKG